MFAQDYFLSHMDFNTSGRSVIGLENTACSGLHPSSREMHHSESWWPIYRLISVPIMFALYCLLWALVADTSKWSTDQVIISDESANSCVSLGCHWHYSCSVDSECSWIAGEASTDYAMFTVDWNKELDWKASNAVASWFVLCLQIQQEWDTLHLGIQRKLFQICAIVG